MSVIIKPPSPGPAGQVSTRRGNEGAGIPVSKKFRLLIVDDEAFMTKVASRVLAAPDLSITVSNNPVEALALFGKERFDLVLSDFHMPVMNGMELLRGIKGLEPRTPVIIVSGGISSDEKNQVLGAGAFCVIVKPYERADLVDAVSNALATIKPPSAIEPAVESIVCQSLARMLYIDSSLERAAILGFAGLSCGMQVMHSENGDAAGLLMKASGADLVCVHDGMDAEALRLVASMADLEPRVKVIVLTAGGPERKDALTDAGACRVLSWPSNPGAVMMAACEALASF